MIWWAAILLAFGLGIAAVEMFVPTGGVLGVISALAIIAAIGLAFSQRTWYGMGFLTVTLLGLPVLFAVAVQVWPRTTIGRRFLLNAPQGDDVLPDNDLRRELRELVGRIGQAQSPMMPSGSVLIEGRPVDATSEGMAIEQGEWVQVVEVRGMRVVVRPAPGPPPPPADPLSQTYDDAAPAPFEDPFA
jgi:membrane-bound serine protease (ClpP class)